MADRSTLYSCMQQLNKAQVYLQRKKTRFYQISPKDIECTQQNPVFGLMSRLQNTSEHSVFRMCVRMDCVYVLHLHVYCIYWCVLVISVEHSDFGMHVMTERTKIVYKYVHSQVWKHKTCVRINLKRQRIHIYRDRWTLVRAGTQIEVIIWLNLSEVFTSK